MIVAHGHMLSIFNVLKEEWAHKFKYTFEADISYVFRMKGVGKNNFLAVILTNQRIYTI
jgi:hypothetical protein